MILANDKYEQVRDLQDISKIIREKYNEDLADELDKLIPKHTDEEYYELERKISGLDHELYLAEDDVFYLDKENKDLKIQIKDLKRIIEELEEANAKYS